MARAATNPPNATGDSTSDSKDPVATRHAGDPQPPQQSDADHPRIIEEHHIVGPHGEDEIEATDERGRRWYHLRPEPRSRYDFIGFNYTWWLIWILFIFIVFLPWGHGWGYRARRTSSHRMTSVSLPMVLPWLNRIDLSSVSTRNIARSPRSQASRSPGASEIKIRTNFLEKQSARSKYR